jgi:membrane protein DedA with SNARE-associated domain
MNPAGLAELLEHWGYPTYLMLLVATGVGSPIPEDLILATAGYLISARAFSWPGAVIVGVLGVVASDVLLYAWGRRLHAGVSRGWMGRLVRPHHLAAAERWLVRLGDKAVFFGRLLPGTRTVAFIGAGVRRMPLRRFLLFDVLGAVVWVPAVLFAGSQIGEEIGGLEQLLARLARSAVWVGLGVVILAALWKWRGAEASKL